jgi:hypothetical protein
MCIKYIMGKKSKRNLTKRRGGNLFNLFRKKGKTEKNLQKSKRVKIGTETKELAAFNNEQDCLMELRKPKNKGAKCRLIGYASYAAEKEVPVYNK